MCPKRIAIGDTPVEVRLSIPGGHAHSRAAQTGTVHWLEFAPIIRTLVSPCPPGQIFSLSLLTIYLATFLGAMVQRMDFFRSLIHLDKMVSR